MNVINKYVPFVGNDYKTPDDRKESFLNKLFLRTRLAFYIKNFYVYYITGTAGKRGELDWQNQAAYSFQNMMVAEDCGAKFNITGLDNIDKVEGPVLFVGNHMSLLETAVMSAFLTPRKPTIFVVKQSLFDIPIFGNIMRGMGNIPLERKNPRVDLKVVMQEGTRKLSEGTSIIIFPQSTRDANFDPTKFGSIAIKLAKKAGVPIIPFALKTDFLENGKLIKDMGPIHPEKKVFFEFGEPMNIEGNGKAQHQEIIEFIQDRLKKWSN